VVVAVVSAQDATGVIVLIAGAVIAVVELALSGWIYSLPTTSELEDERPSSLPDRYVVGSERDPFAVRGRR
jgi:hypothetical protein